MDLGHNLFRFLARQQVVEKLPIALLALSETSPGSSVELTLMCPWTIDSTLFASCRDL